MESTLSRNLVWIWFVAIIAAVSNANAQDASQDTGGEEIVWVGCGITKKAFMSELVAAYTARTGTEIKLEGGGATKGIRSVAAGKSQMGGTCRYRITDYLEEMRVRFVPIAWDALVVVVHKDNPLDSISFVDLQRLYWGEISNWKQLGGPDMPLELYVREGKISGVGRTLRELVFEDPSLDFPMDHAFKSSGPLEKKLEQSPQGIAATGVSSARKRDIKILKLDGVEPSYENIKTGRYLLFRPLYIVTQKRSKTTEDFMKFIFSKDGRDIVRANDVVPYLEASELTTKQLSQLDAIRQYKKKVGAK